MTIPYNPRLHPQSQCAWLCHVAISMPGVFFAVGFSPGEVCEMSYKTHRFVFFCLKTHRFFNNLLSDTLGPIGLVWLPTETKPNLVLTLSCTKITKSRRNKFHYISLLSYLQTNKRSLYLFIFFK